MKFGIMQGRLTNQPNIFYQNIQKIGKTNLDF